MRWMLVLVLLGGAVAQEPPPNGPRRVDPQWHALVGATVHAAPGKTLADATVVLRGDRIASVSTEPPPPGARVWDLKGHHVYAGFLDAHVPVAPPPVKGSHWHPRVTPERLALEVDAKTAEELRALGFTAGVAAPNSGIFRGRASLVSFPPPPEDGTAPPVHARGVYQALAFEITRSAKEGHPTSQMGAIALIRQSLLDGLAPDETLLFDTDDELEALRAAKIAREMGRRAVVLGGGLEFRRLDAIVADGYPLVVPLRFPAPPDVSSVGAANDVDLRELMTWEQAPTNPRRLDAKGLTVALTTAKLPRRDRFRRHLAEAIRHGLDPERALAMLTQHPARILGVEDRFGTIEKGKLAHLVVTEGPYFDADPDAGKLRALWIDGKHVEIAPAEPDAAGTWEAELPALPGRVVLTVGARKERRERRWSVTVRIGDVETKAKRVKVRGAKVSFAFETEAGRFALSGAAAGPSLHGHGLAPDGTRFAWTATLLAPAPTPAKEPREPPDVPERYGTPFGPYARDGLPPQPERLVLRGATLWTGGPAGVVENGELEIRAGRIVYVGPARDGEAIDVTGRHVTPGLVDCHSHTGISRGVNEAGEAVTAEVRIGDVTDPDDISWYRQLAGGVTTVNSLHGSANPIGGQNQVNKVRWGVPHPDGMHFEGAPPGIKFALGENVKQSNWGDDFTSRYPQTRMGVETLIRDRFLAAREYARGHERRDLELEALAEILAGERLIHCHSYRQDEILMLCRLAGEFGFRIGTFQHVLEGYKVAEAIRDHALGGSAFSDWWAYKVEVQDAIPWNGALMHDVGVVVSFNSDSNELARRLNLEAAKAVKYGGLAPHEALKFVALNAAIQLGIADRVGSLEAGKDADFAVWSGPPLSTYSRCVATWIDGREYFSLEQDRVHRERIAAERSRIVQKLLGKRRDLDEDEEEEEEAAGPAEAAALARLFRERLRDDGVWRGAGCDECDRLFTEEGR